MLDEEARVYEGGCGNGNKHSCEEAEAGDELSDSTSDEDDANSLCQLSAGECNSGAGLPCVSLLSMCTVICAC